MADHGTRACYQQGCRQLACRAANATYQQTYRVSKQHGQQPLGAKVSAIELWRTIRRLKAEHFTKAEIARRLGVASGRLKFSGDAVTVRNALKVRRLARQFLHETPEPPL